MNDNKREPSRKVSTRSDPRNTGPSRTARAAPSSPLPGLPIDAHRDEVLAALQTGRPLIVEAATGSGKSTRLPLWLLAGASDKSILVVEPRRVAARSLARFVAQLQGEAVGESVGYRVRFEDRTTKETKLIFVTPGIALRMLRAGPAHWPSAIVLDEFHERSLQTDLCAARILASQRDGTFRGSVIITSATLDGETLAAKIDATRIVAEGRSFPVSIRYHESGGNPRRQDLDQRVCAAVAELAAELPEGDILVFLPGKGEISACQRALQGWRRDPWQVLPLHGGLRADEVDRAFAAPRGHRRVFLATNVAETSVTLPYVRAVIDSGLVRQVLHRGGRNALALVATSLASMEQRAGRAGRTAAGICCRLFSSRFSPPEQNLPEIERASLDDLVIDAASVGLTGRALENAPWITPPPVFALQSSIARLRARGLIDDEGLLTSRGTKLSLLPVSANVARALIDAPSGLGGLVADTLALVERDRDLLLPLIQVAAAEREGVEHARSMLLAGARSDLEVQLRCLRQGHAAHQIHNSGIIEVKKMANQLRALVGAASLQVPAPAPRPAELEALARHFLVRLPEQAYVVRDRARSARGLKNRTKQRGNGRDDEPWANGHEEIWLPAFSTGDDAGSKPPDAGLILNVIWLGQERGLGVRGRGRLFLPCERAWLVEAGLGEKRVTTVRMRKHRGSVKFVGEVEHVLADTVLAQRDETLRGELLIEHVAAAIEAGKLMAPAGKNAQQDLQIVQVARAFDAQLPALAWDNAAAWFRFRLEELGLQTSADLELIDASDLAFDLAALGLDEEEAKKLATDFPDRWEFGGVVHALRVERRPRLQVVLEPTGSAKAKARAQPPPVSVLPRFRGLGVVWKKASRSVTLR